jgi:hypothetical protein
VDARDSGSTSKAALVHVIAGRLTQVGETHVTVGRCDRIRLAAGLTISFVPGQRVTICALLIDGEFVARSIVLATRL